MRAGRVEEAGALAVRIGKDMARHSKSHLNKIDGKANAKDMWTAVLQLWVDNRNRLLSTESMQSH